MTNLRMTNYLMPWSFDIRQLVIRHFHWGVQDSNLRRQSHQIYSLTRLTASVTPRATSNSQSSYNAEYPLATFIADGDRNSASADLPTSTIVRGSVPVAIARILHRTNGAIAPAIRHGHSPWRAPILHTNPA